MDKQTNTNLQGKVALVTGGSRSIGAAIAKRLAVDGASVALTYSASPDQANEVVKRSKPRAAKRWQSAPTQPTPQR